MGREIGDLAGVFGPNNLGKSTAIEGVVADLKSRGLVVASLKFPRYDLEPTGPRINRYLRMGNPESWTMEQAQEVFAQNRRDFESELIEMLGRHDLMVVEDYVGTGIAWGMIGGIPIERMEEINEGLHRIDLGILLDGERFLTGVEKGHTHEDGDYDWDRSRQIHKQLASRYGWRVVNANQRREDVVDDISRIIMMDLKIRK